MKKRFIQLSMFFLLYAGTLVFLLASGNNITLTVLFLGKLFILAVMVWITIVQILTWKEGNKTARSN